MTPRDLEVQDNDLLSTFPGPPRMAPEPIVVAYKRATDASLIASLVDGLKSHMMKFSVLGINDLVVGLSGGVDSTVAACLLMESGLAVSGVIVEVDGQSGLSETTARTIDLAKRIGIRHQMVDATRLYATHLELFAPNSRLARVHLRSRLINTIVFQYADSHGAAVIDTRDKSEVILRIYEESFRGHIAPLAHLYKSEVYDLADFFGLTELRGVPSGCPELVNSEAFGMDFDSLDPILHLLTEKRVPIEAMVDDYRLDPDWLSGLERRMAIQPLRTRTHEIGLE